MILLLYLHKIPGLLGKFRAANTAFSAVDVAMATPPSDKTDLDSPESSPRQPEVLRKSSLAKTVLSWHCGTPVGRPNKLYLGIVGLVRSALLNLKLALPIGYKRAWEPTAEPARLARCNC